jgi:hypothetical protein
MKEVTINTKDGPIQLIDDGDQTTEEMIEFLLDVMRSNTLATIHTTYASTLIRPSYISSIIVKDNITQPTKKDSSIQPEINNEESEQTVETTNEDIVTDME